MITPFKLLLLYRLIDILAIIPYFIGFNGHFTTLKAFRLFRLLRLLKLTRYVSALNRYKQAFKEITPDLVIFSTFSAILLYLASVGIYHFEHGAQPESFRSIFDAIWWSIVSLTTTGYGDIYPITAGGRIFSGCALVIGLGIFAVPTGLIASALTRAR